MKAVKFIVVAVAGSLVAFFLYANLRTVSPSEDLKTIQLGVYHIRGLASEQESVSLQKKVAALKGVTACTVRGATAGVTYYPDEVGKGELSALLSDNGKHDVVEQAFSSTGKECPVHDWEIRFNQFVRLFDLRH